MKPRSLHRYGRLHLRFTVSLDEASNDGTDSDTLAQAQEWKMFIKQVGTVCACACGRVCETCEKSMLSEETNWQNTDPSQEAG